MVVPPPGGVLFELKSPAETGISFTNELAPEYEATNHNLLNGSGVAIGDVDADGWNDLFFCNLTGTSRLYRNLGQWKFSDVTTQAGLSNANWQARGAAFADVDGDGDQDLLVTFSGQGARLFLNSGKGAFIEAKDAGLSADTGSMSLALGDVDGDSDLDLYITNYGENTIRSGMKVTTRMVGGREQVVGRYRNRLRIINGNLVEYGEPDAFFLNEGQGKFRRVSWTEGAFKDENGAALTEPPWELGFTAVIRDINQDGHPDIYVCNDFQDPDRLWLGDGRGSFQAAPRVALRSTPNFSMTADFADLNNDGWDDFIVTDMLSRSHELRMRQLKPESPSPLITREKGWDRPQVRRNFLYLNRGDGTYTDIANYANVAISDWSWSAAFIDADLDGWQDVIIGTGHYYDTQDQDAIERTRSLSPAERNDGRKLLDTFPPLVTPNFAFRNLRNLTFSEVGASWGLNSPQVTHGIALGDLDNDGDLDVVANCLRAPALVYRNNCSAPRVAVKLTGNKPNITGIGARLVLKGGATPIQSAEVTAGSRFVSGDPPLRVFAAGKSTAGMILEVTWRSGSRSVVSNVQPNLLYTVEEKFAAKSPKSVGTNPTPWFEDVSSKLNHKHTESAHDDFARQATLPKRISQLGPGLVWHDVNGDGREDLLLGAARGGRPTILINPTNGAWGITPIVATPALADDTAGMVAFRLTPGRDSFVLALASLESENQPNFPAVMECSPTNTTSLIPRDGSGTSPGPIAVSDVDNDGDLDLFVGGRLIPGRYPESAESRLFLNDGGRLHVASPPVVPAALKTNGLTTAALFTDLTSDGMPELVTCGEWGPVRIFRNLGGKLSAWDPQVQGIPGGQSPKKLSDLLGWWSAAGSGDFDNDGKLDLVLGNLGLNSGYAQVSPGPWMLFHGDLNEDGSTQVFEAYRDPTSTRVVPWRDLAFMEKTLPWLRAKFPTHVAYAKATMNEILGERMRRARVTEANFSSSILLLNRGESFELRDLPVEAQWTPVMGLGVADFNGDGNQDVFLTQNNFAVRPEDGRMDAGRGILLAGDGTGSLRAIPGQTSGIMIYGEQRSCAAADFDQDGRMDLAVAENNGPVRLFHNTNTRPGLRVALAGGPGNPTAIGATVRVLAPTAGPALEMQCGSGFWAQNSPVQILSAPADGARLQVRWPGGKVTESAIPTGARSILVNSSGEISLR